MPELSLNNVDRHPLPGELDSVRVPHLMGREPAAHPGLRRQLAKFCADSGRRPRATTSGAVDYAEQRPDR
jgi:hypothetical protein